MFGWQSSAEGQAQLTGTELSEGVFIHVATGIDAALYSGQGFEGEEFRGSALVRYTGKQQIEVQGYTLLGASGVFHLTQQNNTLTVAALTMPLLVKSQDAMIIIPAGTQWQSTQEPKLNVAVAPLPQRFLARQMHIIDELPPATTVVTETAVEPSWLAQLTFVDPILLPKTRSAVQQERSQQAKALLQQAITAGDVLNASVALQGVTGDTDHLSVVLESMPHDSAITLDILDAIITNDEHWLVYASHPRWRDAVWTMSYTHQSPNTVALGIASLPLSDTQPRSVTPLARQRWLETVTWYAQSVADPVPFLEDMVRGVGSYAARINKAGYPQRSRDWTAALQQLPEVLTMNLPQGTLDRIAHLQQLDAVDTSAPIELPKTAADKPEALEVVAVPEEKAAEEAYTPAIVEQRTLRMLQDMGAIFTVETSVSAVAPNTAAVRGVLFSTPSGDYTYTFSYNVVHGEIRDVIRNNKEYPYALDISAFRKWVQQ